MNAAPPETPSPVEAGAGGPDARLSPFDIPLRTLDFRAPLRWLGRGWQDLMRAPVVALFYGSAFVLAGWALMLVFRHAPAYTVALSAGFLLMGPIVALGLYDVSRRLEQGQPPDLGRSMLAWESRLGTLGIFGGVLLVLEMLWARASLVVFALSFDGMPDFKGSILALLDPANLSFIVAYLAVGGVFAGLIYAVTVISIPMLLDRPTDAITAGLTSLRLVLTQPGVMLWWGVLITVLVVLAMLPWFIGLLVVGPWLGFASWHAYRDATAVGATTPPQAG